MVAVVEDDPSMLKSIERLLKAHDFQPVTFTSAEAFLQAAAATTAACLVLDLHLGGMSGIELRRQLTASGSNLPVVFMSAADDESVRQKAVEAGCVAYFHKPFSAHYLICAVNNAVVVPEIGT
jgi:FixJ family two-component response regulator